MYCRENFIQVDVFYQEISFEEIQQNKAFEFLSLLSEVRFFTEPSSARVCCFKFFVFFRAGKNLRVYILLPKNES